MIHFRTYNSLDTILQSEAECYVNMTNILGQYENSLSSHFFKAFPAYDKWYLDNCQKRIIQLGKGYVFSAGDKIIISLAYKRSGYTTIWLPHIIECVKELARIINELGVSLIAMPAVGHKLHPAKWGVIKQTYIDHLCIEGTEVFIYANKKISI